MSAPLRQVATLPLPADTLRHPFVRELETLLRALSDTESPEHVLGTANHTPKVQLYGWRPCVPPHVDNTGWIYFLPLRVPRRGSVVYIQGAGPQDIKPGSVYCLDDYQQHGTYEDKGLTLCLFYGPLPMPADDMALAQLQRGLEALADRSRWDAPRVAYGMRIMPLRGECFAAGLDSPVQLMRTADAKRRGMLIARCAICDRLAAKHDHHFPWDVAYNRCRAHLKE